MMSHKELDSMIATRLIEIYMAFKQGKDVPPATLYRHEGLIEAACIIGLYTIEQAQEKIISCWYQVFKEPFPDEGRVGVSIPVAMVKAPVYPSTKD